MPISFNRFVNITSGVAAGTEVSRRELIARMFSSSAELPTESDVEFSSAQDVIDYFGSGSNEALRASFYFGFLSKNQTRPQKISFSRWANADTAPTVLGASITTTLAQFQAVTAGQIVVTFGAITETITAIDLSADASLSDVAAGMQAAIQGANVDPLFASATVTYNATRARFELVGGATGAAVVVITGTGSDQNLSALLGWQSASTRLSNGVATETVTETISQSATRDNNFGSFGFVDSLSTAEKTEAGTWVNGQNLLYQYHTGVLAADASAVQSALSTFAGVGITLLSASTSEYPEMLPMAILAATNYDRRNSVQNYMFQVAGGLTPTVTNNADADTYDALRINYYGRTQQAGSTLDFYQRGVLQGPATVPRDMNTFANEQWLKDAAGAQIMTILLSLNRVPANLAGRALTLDALRGGVIETALINGSISVGVTLSAADIAFVTGVTNDDQAYLQIQNTGYWLDAEINLVGGENRIDYTLIYTKDESIRMVDGTHSLI